MCSRCRQPWKVLREIREKNSVYSNPAHACSCRSAVHATGGPIARGTVTREACMASGDCVALKGRKGVLMLTRCGSCSTVALKRQHSCEPWGHLLALAGGE